MKIKQFLLALCQSVTVGSLIDQQTRQRNAPVIILTSELAETKRRYTTMLVFILHNDR